MIITGKYPSLRLRRARKQLWTRRLLEENNLTSSDFILPVFIMEGKNKTLPIKSMPGVYKYTVDRLNKIVDKTLELKLPMIALFPETGRQKKNHVGSESINPNNLVCRSLRHIKNKYKNEIGLMCDVALDPYTSHGHDGILKDGYVLNDETNNVLKKQALLQAEMGCDVLAPSDMMDGRIGAIRKILDKNNFINVQLLSYAVKYASNFYGPFRSAIGSKNKLKGNKTNYQMNFKNSAEAIREVSLDIKEGADMVMVKPGLPYLDIIKLVNDKFKIPVLAYQVSGEYSLLQNGIKNKIINENAIYESLISLKRSGATAIISYFADRIDKIIPKI